MNKKAIARFLPLALITVLLGLAACSSISKGVTEAILEQQTEDTRECHISGAPYEGVLKSVLEGRRTNPAHSTKILMVHGIAKHMPDYSAELRGKLAKALALDTVDEVVKEIHLSNPEFPDAQGKIEDLGELHIFRYMNQARDREMLFYELTWSSITEERKQIIAYDDGAGQSYRRAAINSTMKTFLNATVPDLLVYLGNKKGEINASVSQAVCWMFNGDWDSLPREGYHFCNSDATDMSGTVRDDDFFFITHSLGSRITVDTIQNFGAQKNDQNLSPNMEALVAAVRNKTMTVFMLSNQLPLLQMAYDKPVVAGQFEQYCSAGAPLGHQRILKKLEIVAFSDPNDILSYSVPPRFTTEYIDSRICPEMVNVSLNISGVRNLFGAADFADPLGAHSDYLSDDRVLSLIVHGLDRRAMDGIVRDRCAWTELVH